MIYVARDKELYIRSVKLTEKEEKMLFMLASHEMLTYERMEKEGLSKQDKFRLVDKSRMKVTTIANVGYRLEEEVYFMGIKE